MGEQLVGHTIGIGPTTDRDAMAHPDADRVLREVHAGAAVLIAVGGLDAATDMLLGPMIAPAAMPFTCISAGVGNALPLRRASTSEFC